MGAVRVRLRNRTALGGAYLIHGTPEEALFAKRTPRPTTYLQGRYGRRGLATTYLPAAWSAALHHTIHHSPDGAHPASADIFRASGHQAPSVESWSCTSNRRRPSSMSPLQHAWYQAPDPSSPPPCRHNPRPTRCPPHHISIQRVRDLAAWAQSGPAPVNI